MDTLAYGLHTLFKTYTSLFLPWRGMLAHQMPLFSINSGNTAQYRGRHEHFIVEGSCSLCYETWAVSHVFSYCLFASLKIKDLLFESSGAWSSKFCVCLQVLGTLLALIISMQCSFVSLRSGTALNLLWRVGMPVWVCVCALCSPNHTPSLTLSFSQSERVLLNQWIGITGLNFKVHLFLHGGHSCQLDAAWFRSSQKITCRKVASNLGEESYHRVYQLYTIWVVPMK